MAPTQPPALEEEKKKKKRKGVQTAAAGAASTTGEGNSTIATNKAKGKGKKASMGNSTSSGTTGSSSTAGSSSSSSSSSSKRRRSQGKGGDDDQEEKEGEGSSNSSQRGKKDQGNSSKKGGLEDGALMKVLEDPNLFPQIFGENGWLYKSRDVVALGSTCRTLKPVRAPQGGLSIDLTQALSTLRYPNRWLRNLASSASVNLKALSIARPDTREMALELGSAFKAGHLCNLRELTLSQCGEQMPLIFKTLLQATEASLLPSLRVFALHYCRLKKSEWALLDAVLKAESEAKKKKPASTSWSAFPSRRILIDSVRAKSSLAYLTSLSLRETNIPTATLENWFKALHRHRSGLQELTLQGNDLDSPKEHATSILPFLLQSLSSGAFPTLQLFAIDEVRLAARDAACFVEALAKGCEGVKVLKLGNSHACQSSVRYHASSSATEVIAALCRAAIGGPANGDGLRNTLESLTLAWMKMPRKAVRNLTDCLFGGVEQEEEEGGGGGGGGGRQGFHFDSRMQDVPPPSSSSAGTGARRHFPALVAFGLIQRESDSNEGGTLTQCLPFLKLLLRACLARGIANVDLTYNGLVSYEILADDDEIAHHLRTLPPDQKFHVDLTQYILRTPHAHGTNPPWHAGKKDLRTFIEYVQFRGPKKGGEEKGPIYVGEKVVVKWGEEELEKMGRA